MAPTTWRSSAPTMGPAKSPLDRAAQNAWRRRRAENLDVQPREAVSCELAELSKRRPRDDLGASAVDIAHGLDDGKPVRARQGEISNEEDGRSEATQNAERFFA